MRGCVDAWIWGCHMRLAPSLAIHLCTPFSLSRARHLSLSLSLSTPRFHPSQVRIRAALNASDPLLAYRLFDEMINGDEYPYPTYYANVTGMKTNYFNFEQGPDGSSLSTNHFIGWLGTAAGRLIHHR